VSATTVRLAEMLTILAGEMIEDGRGGTGQSFVRRERGTSRVERERLTPEEVLVQLSALQAAAAMRMAALTRRQREILEWMANGESNKTIGLRLGLSPRTVEVHRAELMKRLGVPSMAEAVRIWFYKELPLNVV
jgi:DNA-binding NarL/FixJ family response regulator